MAYLLNALPIICVGCLAIILSLLHKNFSVMYYEFIHCAETNEILLYKILPYFLY